jgi:hypothetical protein
MTENKIDESLLQRYVFSRLLFIPQGGFPNSVMLLLRALLYVPLRFIPETLRTRAVEFITDAPRVPSDSFPEIPMDVWERVAYRDDEISFLRNNRNIRDLTSYIEHHGSKQLRELLQPELLKRYNGREAGQIPRLGAAFAALEAGEYNRFTKTWMEELSTDIAALRPESTLPLAVLNHGVRTVSIPDDKELTVVCLFGTRGGTGGGLSQASAIVTRHIARMLGVNVKLVAVTLSGPYRSADGSERTKEALEYALLRDLEDSLRWDAKRSFPVGPIQTLEHTGPVWDSIHRIEISSFLAHNEAAALNYVARILEFWFFTRVGYELRKNLGNEEMQLNVADMVAFAK